LHIIKKFFSGTLANNKNFVNSARKLWKYVENNLNKTTSQFGESLPINIIYKKIISDFHQAFFIKKTMFPEYSDLSEIVDDYNNTIKYINKSCILFKNEKHNENTLESISINFADRQMGGQMDVQMDGGSKISKKQSIILHNNVEFDDMVLDNTPSMQTNKNILQQVHTILKNEINFLGKLSNSI
jgi:hypothetical protein